MLNVVFIEINKEYIDVLISRLEENNLKYDIECYYRDKGIDYGIIKLVIPLFRPKGETYTILRDVLKECINGTPRFVDKIEKIKQ